MKSKRILIVDDDRTVLDMLQHTLVKMNFDYEVFATSDGVQALEMVQQQPFDVVLADYMMPGITGIDLARALRQIAPETAVVLMTAYGTTRLKDTSKVIGVDGYLDKPFAIDELYRIIRKAAALRKNEQALEEFEMAETPDTLSPKQPLRKNLQQLLVNTNSRAVLFLDVDGQPVDVVGQIDNVEIEGIGRFAADNFSAAKAVSPALNSQGGFKSGYYEWSDFNIYTYNINDQFILVIIFGTEHKPGVVWFYTRQTATMLAAFLTHSS